MSALPDRTRIPRAASLPAVSLIDDDKLKRRRLANGADLRLYRYKKLPVVQIYLVVRAGMYTDPAEKAGLTNLFAAMLDEGTASRTSLQIADDFDFLGTHFNTWATADACGTSLLTLQEHLDASLEIFADIVANPSFPDAEMERERRNVLTGILQEDDQPNVVATRVFVNAVYGKHHPYGYMTPGTAASVRSLSRTDLFDKYERYFKASNASIVVVGDLELDEIAEKMETALSTWRSGDAAPVDLPAVPEPNRSTIYLVDRPGAAQSQIRVGHRGIERTHPDYFPVRIMNQILGGQFTSRINLNLREAKGYTYGATSTWDMRKHGGHFVTSGGFQGEYTDASVAEIVKELHRIREDGVTDAELLSAREGLIRALPRQFETPSQISMQIGSVALYDLPDSYFDTYIENIREVSADAVKRAAGRYIQPSGATIVVVGDADKIKQPLADLGIGEVVAVANKG
jgi:zinc protease